MEKHNVKEPSEEKNQKGSLHQHTLCLASIFHSEKNGILLVREYNSLYHLPGGIIHHNPDSLTFIEQLKREEDVIKKFIFEQSGHPFEIKTPIAHFNFVNRGIIYKGFYLITGHFESKKQWFRKKKFNYTFLQPAQIADARIKYEDKQIICYYLLHQEEIKAKNKPNSPFSPVIAIAG